MQCVDGDFSNSLVIANYERQFSTHGQMNNNSGKQQSGEILTAGQLHNMSSNSFDSATGGVGSGGRNERNHNSAGDVDEGGILGAVDSIFDTSIKKLTAWF